MYLTVKHSHMFFVAVTAVLFNLRFWLRAAKPAKPLPGLLNVLPHLNDTLLLFTGLWLMSLAHWTPFGNAHWLGVKLLLVLAYIFSGLKALKAAPRSRRAGLFYAAAMLCLVAVYHLARFKPF
ncbi:SirB2 family protein [Neisseria leonii]|uniref:SirB2 family protein n=1 Tax=Neisseria leonii TaxID=2995413 RepID=A0A9X4E3I8_9NEIS|nr:MULTISPECIES: SirB2 family protein [unclassified Neisseria]MDD9325173.1 SirB2 family protein [Neisseria sp. 3986]MDD9327286.1 SirB2 family protein [Neisseria sp. 51.81]